MRFTLAAGIPGASPCGELVASIARWFCSLIAGRACAALEDWAAALPDGGERTEHQTDMLADVLSAADWFASRKARILNLFRRGDGRAPGRLPEGAGKLWHAADRIVA